MENNIKSNNLFDHKKISKNNLFDHDIYNNAKIEICADPPTIFHRSYAIFLGRKYVIELSKFEQAVGRTLRPKTYIGRCKITSSIHGTIMMKVAHYKEVKELEDEQKRNRFRK